MTRLRLSSLAGIAYAGIPGSSADCMTAVLQLLFYGDRIASAKILTHDGSHCLLLRVGESDLVAIKSGFASGYSGEGPRSLSFVLQAMMAFDVEIEEYEVPEDYLARLDASALTSKDIELFERLRPIRPSRWYDYGHPDSDRREKGILFVDLEPRLPLAIIDSRIMDLAIHFEHDPDSKLLTGYRRLEDLVRERTGLAGEFSTKLFAKAFSGEESLLYWEGIDGAEQQGRVLLFTGTYMAHRNPRAHQERRHGLNKYVSEFLLLNHLFSLERQATVRPSPSVSLKSGLP
jgi:hypothetical protein